MVDPRDVAEMARIRAIVSGAISMPEPTNTDIRESMKASTSVDPKEDMKSILRMFQAGTRGSDALTESVSRIHEDTQTDRRLREAVMTESTPQGMQMGSWKINVYDEGGMKHYDVINVATEEPIATDLTLYESALSLTKLLNFHVSINSQRVREVLDLEERYSRARQDAAMFRVRIKQRKEAKDFGRAAIAEDRYQEARAEALSLRESLIAISRRL